MTTTSTHSNTAAVAAMYEAFGRGDIAAILSHLSEDVAGSTPRRTSRPPARNRYPAEPADAQRIGEQHEPATLRGAQL